MADLGIFINWLQMQHDKIMECEREALEDLEKSNIEGYNLKMLEKAKMLASLGEEGAAHLSEVPPLLRAKVESVLEGYSINANTALELHSVFYMSALLYPDEHKKGEPDNMQRFIDDLKKHIH